MTTSPAAMEVRGETAAANSIAAAAQLACLLEASAPKPGNVCPGRHFADIRYEDFLASAVAVGPVMGGAGTRPLGVTVRLAVEATARWTRSNTNLGIILLLAPLARGAATLPGSSQRLEPAALRERVRRVLAATTVQDAREAYAAIRRAAPGGLGKAEKEDVADEPTVTLVEAMRLAAARDGIAREYATAYHATFTIGAPALVRARRDGLTWDDAVVETFLTLLAAAPDTHVARRGGTALAAGISRRAAAALRAGGVRTEFGRRMIARMDQVMRDADNIGNPGTSADLTAAAIFVALLGGAWGMSHGGRHAATR